MTTLLLALILTQGPGPVQPPVSAAPTSTALFTDAERAQLVAYWNAVGRVAVQPPPNVPKRGLWQVRLTPDGSTWFFRYQIAIGAAKAPPTQVPTAAPAAATWKTWVDAKLAYDRWQAQCIADAANAALNVGKPAALPLSAPPVPGPIPADLQAACGDPPALAAAVVPMQTTVTFDDGDAYAYEDNVKLPPAYAYYRFPQGTDTPGIALKNMTDAELDPLFAAAGFTPSEQRIVKAVSKLEGGFDSVNTYDTGYVSIGFIQYITARDGNGDLLAVLQREKTEQPDAFAQDFHRYGIDVTPAGIFDVVDPATGAELTGADAVMKTITDKRLTAILQRAGLHSRFFRIAQIEVVKTKEWPADDPVTVNMDGQTCTCKVCDVVKSEAGLTTLFDRKVNRGNIAPFPAVLARVMRKYHLMTPTDAAKYEREIIAACKYRTDFLADRTLSQPPAASVETDTTTVQDPGR